VRDATTYIGSAAGKSESEEVRSGLHCRAESGGLVKGRRLVMS
jgi:hypothetical protein